MKHFHWTIRLFWPIRFDVTIVSIGNNCSVKPDWPESPFGIVVKLNLIGQNHTVNWGIPLYDWVQRSYLHYFWSTLSCHVLKNVIWEATVQYTGVTVLSYLKLMQWKWKCKSVLTFFTWIHSVYCAFHVLVQTNFRRYHFYFLQNQAQILLDHFNSL